MQLHRPRRPREGGCSRPLTLVWMEYNPVGHGLVQHFLYMSWQMPHFVFFLIPMSNLNIHQTHSVRKSNNSSLTLCVDPPFSSGLISQIYDSQMLFLMFYSPLSSCKRTENNTLTSGQEVTFLMTAVNKYRHHVIGISWVWGWNKRIFISLLQT